MAILIIGEPFVKDGMTNRYVRAKCECGKEWDTIWGSRRRIKSCGCLRPGGGRLTHGHCKKVTSEESPEYRSWRAMHSRCNNPNDKMFHRYGGRGIKICERWESSFANFLEDMGAKEKGYTLERNDSDKDYCPENCKWASRKEQNRNRSITKMLTVYGVTRPFGEWCEIGNVNYDVAKNRLRRGWSNKEAIFGKLKT